jgi:DNA-binding transcriptional MerR regulator
MTIQQLSQEIGIGIDTLRIWERRYGFPVPGRDARGHRSYSQEQVEELRVVKSLQSFGQRPGKIFSLAAAERRELLAQLTAQSLPQDDSLQRLAYQMSPSEIATEMASQLQSHGLGNFIYQFAVPLLQLLDHGWTSGQLSIAREHLISDQLENLLKAELTGSPLKPEPAILFLTLNGERHKLGLLLAAVLFEQAGVPAIWMSEDLPLSEIPALAADLGVAGVALSFSGHYSPRQAKQDLSSLRKSLAPEITIIAGGHAVRQVTGLPNLLVCTDLQQIEQLAKRYFRSANGKKERS